MGDTLAATLKRFDLTAPSLEIVTSLRNATASAYGIDPVTFRYVSPNDSYNVYTKLHGDTEGLRVDDGLSDGASDGSLEGA